TGNSRAQGSFDGSGEAPRQAAAYGRADSGGGAARRGAGAAPNHQRLADRALSARQVLLQGPDHYARRLLRAGRHVARSQYDLGRRYPVRPDTLPEQSDRTRQRVPPQRAPEPSFAVGRG